MPAGQRWFRVTAAAQQPDPYARWVSSLHCGHQARTRGRPRTGGWITCPDGRCQGQRRVDAVAAVTVVLVMDPLFDLEACDA